MFNQGDLVAYINGNTVEIGKIKSIINDKAFVYYHTGDTAARTSLSDLKLISNAYCIKEPFLGQSQVEPCEWCIRITENIPKNYCQIVAENYNIVEVIKMKEVLFRGKSKDTKEWVYGYVWIKETPDEKTAYIIDNQGKLTEVILETVGQYVGLTDVNDTKIFEGDKVWCTSGVSYNGVCEFEKYFLVEYGWSESMWIILQCDTVEVIGNVFD